jgi:hypothetical protein
MASPWLRYNCFRCFLGQIFRSHYNLCRLYLPKLMRERSQSLFLKATRLCSHGSDPRGTCRAARAPAPRLAFLQKKSISSLQIAIQSAPHPKTLAVPSRPLLAPPLLLRGRPLSPRPVIPPRYFLSTPLSRPRSLLTSIPLRSRIW